jgi:glycosyltransferase involved in cell wall biosynthesis
MESGTVHISIIVPNYNHARFLRQRLDSVFNQSFSDTEIILLDDCSTDGSKDILHDYAKHPKVSHVVINSQNTGFPVMQWQKGISLAKGEWIWIAESDDFSDLRFLESMMQYAQQNPTCGVVYCQSFDTDEAGTILSTRLNYTDLFQPNIWAENFSVDGKEFIAKYLKRKNVIPNAGAVLFRKDLIDGHTFDDSICSLRMAADWMFWIRLAASTRIAFLSTPLNYFRSHGATTRHHDSRQKQLQRLMEERCVRSELHELMPKVNQTQEIEILNRKVFAMHSPRNILRRDFWKFRAKGFSRITFAIGFLRQLKRMK